MRALTSLTVTVVAGLVLTACGTGASSSTQAVSSTPDSPLIEDDRAAQARIERHARRDRREERAERRQEARQERRERERERRARARRDAAIRAERRYYFAMDDLAMDLDFAIDSGEPNAIARLRERILQAVNRRLFRTGETSIGGNLLLSAATQAREAAERGDLARMADARRDIVEARTKLAAEALD
ncbi:MAG TPA: hypothetical protein VFR97_11935 [Capillimicrobium sp.]|nr:hypothetical protein [Capillimicrobium sp.]